MTRENDHDPFRPKVQVARLSRGWVWRVFDFFGTFLIGGRAKTQKEARDLANIEKAKHIAELRAGQRRAKERNRGHKWRSLPIFANPAFES